VIDVNQLSRDTVAGIKSVDLPQLLLCYPLCRQTIAVFLENIVHAAIGSVRLLVETAFFLLMAVIGRTHGHHFLPAVTHLLFLHVEYPSRCGGENGLQEVLSPLLLLPNFR
jgi:F0F1-type ATP synthase assembly protein I